MKWNQEDVKLALKIIKMIQRAQRFREVSILTILYICKKVMVEELNISEEEDKNFRSTFSIIAEKIDAGGEI